MRLFLKLWVILNRKRLDKEDQVKFVRYRGSVYSIEITNRTQSRRRFIDAIKSLHK